MSFFNPDAIKVSSPVVRYLTWSSTMQSFVEYNKEEGKNVPVKKGFRFIVLDNTCASIGGYNKGRGSGIYSNMFRDNTDPIIVKYQDNKSVMAKGSYGDEATKNKIKVNGGKYCKEVFVMDGNKDICKITMMGSAVASWIEFTKSNDVNKKPVITWTGFTEETNGGTIYYKPTFSGSDNISPETAEIGNRLYIDVKEYIDSVMNNAYEQSMKEDAEIAIDAAMESQPTASVSPSPQATKQEPEFASSVDDLPQGVEDDLPF